MRPGGAPPRWRSALRSPRLRPRLALALLAAALACGGLGGGCRPPDDAGGSGDLRRSLVASLGPLRVGEARLAGVEWQPAASGRNAEAPARPAVPAGAGLDEAAAAATAVRGLPPPLSRDLRRALSTDRPPTALAAAALYQLAAGRTTEAVELLEEARAAAPADGAIASDLAAVYLARAEEAGGESDVFAALGAAAAAVRAAPDLAEARFNLALALERAGATRQALEAWRRYREAEPESPWSREAERRIRRLARPTPAERWSEARARLSAAVASDDPADVESLVRDHHAEARREVEQELLPEWAAAVAGARPAAAERLLSEARAVAAALAGLGGDRLPQAAVAAVAAVEKARTESASGSPARLAALIEGHLAFRDGLAADREYRVEDALPLFLRAEKALEAGGSPLAGWARVYWAIHRYRQDRFTEALELLEDVPGRAHAAGGPALAGRAEWIRGLTLRSSGRAWAALGAYRQARDHFAEAGEPGHAAVVEGLIAEAATATGDRQEGLRLFARSLSQLGVVLDERGRKAVLDAASDALTAAGDHPAALFLQDEIAARLDDRSSPVEHAFVALKRSRLLRRLEAPNAARSALRSARVRTARISDPALRDLVETEISVTLAELRAAADPAGAEADLDAALAAFSRRGRPFPRTQLHFARARLRLGAGDAAGAEEDLAAALALIERQSEEIVEAVRRDLSFARAEEIAGVLIGLLAERSRGEEAWAAAERARARVLLDLALRAPRGAEGAAAAALPARPVPAAGDLRRRMGAREAVVEYAVLDAETVAWVVRREGVATVRLVAGRAELRELAAVLSSSIRDRAGDREVRAAAGRLAAAILAPLAPHLRAGEPLALVPDGPLISVPFALLPDPATGRPLVEERVLTVAPSAALHVLASERSTAATGTPGGALVIGDPAFDRTSFPVLPRLPGAAREAASVSSLWPAAATLVGADATADALLQRLPQAVLAHVAAHAVAVPDDPLASSLVLAPGDGRDGTVAARDLLGLHLPATRLVVLTACRGALAPETESESLWTLAHAFLAAGVPSVIANLWAVEDRAGERLAVALHRHLAAGSAPAAALRAAQLEMLRSADPRDREPGAWAGFRVVGAG